MENSFTRRLGSEEEARAEIRSQADTILTQIEVMENLLSGLEDIVNIELDDFLLQKNLLSATKAFTELKRRMKDFFDVLDNPIMELEEE